MNTFVLHICFSCLFLLSSLSAKEMHLFMLGDTKDKAIGLSTRKNLLNIQKVFSHIADIANWSFSPKKLTSSDSTLTQISVLSWIQNTPISSDDIVIFYYSGHGWREKVSTTIWPSGFFLNEKKGSHHADFPEIIGELLSKKASFYLILLDSCNSISKDLVVNPPIYAIELSKLFEKTNVGAISRLFQKHGFVIASASSPSEVGWAHVPLNEASMETSNTAGSIFTNVFFNNFFHELQVPKPHWSNILKTTQDHCVNETKKEKYKLTDSPVVEPSPHNYQTPQYRVFLHKKRRKPDTYKRYLFEKCRYKGVQAKECSESDDFDISLDHASNELPKYLILSTE